jgi:hypothetical protein
MLDLAARQLAPLLAQVLPRYTRYEPAGVSVHWYTLLCMSHKPNLFDG